MEERLVGLQGLDAGGHGGLGLILLLDDSSRLVIGVNLGLEGGEVGIERSVLLVGGGEVKLLGGRLHLEGLHRGDSLDIDNVLIDVDSTRRGIRRGAPTCFEGVTCAVIVNVCVVYLVCGGNVEGHRKRWEELLMFEDINCCCM